MTRCGQHQLPAMKIVAADPNVDGVHVGHRRRSLRLNNGRMFYALEDRIERKLSAIQIIQELRPKLAQIPGFNVYLQIPPLIRVGGISSKGLYQYSLQDTDMKELFHWAPILMDKIETAARLSGRDQRSANRQSRRSTWKLTATRPPRWASRRSRSKTRSTTPIGERQASTIYCRRGRILGRL